MRNEFDAEIRQMFDDITRLNKIHEENTKKTPARKPTKKINTSEINSEIRSLMNEDVRSAMLLDFFNRV